MSDGPQASEEAAIPLSLVVNGDPVSVSVPADRRLVGLLREDLGLTGTKIGCEVGVCGACTVLVDDRPVSSCSTLAVQADGAEVVTVEGLGYVPTMRGLQEAFVSEGGFQCGFCTSGQLMAAAALVVSGRVASMSAEELTEHMQGNLCRCTGYYGIFRAIERWQSEHAVQQAEELGGGARGAG